MLPLHLLVREPVQGPGLQLVQPGRPGAGAADVGRGGDRAGRMFERVDADDDGVISEEEFESAKERFEERRGNRSRDRG